MLFLNSANVIKLFVSDIFSKNKLKCNYLKMPCVYVFFLTCSTCCYMLSANKSCQAGCIKGNFTLNLELSAPCNVYGLSTMVFFMLVCVCAHTCAH